MLNVIMLTAMAPLLGFPLFDHLTILSFFVSLSGDFPMVAMKLRTSSLTENPMARKSSKKLTLLVMESSGL
jgi:hypothetical protein